MTKIHKDIAMRLMEVANDEEITDQQVVKVCYIAECTASPTFTAAMISYIRN